MQCRRTGLRYYYTPRAECCKPEARKRASHHLTNTTHINASQYPSNSLQHARYETWRRYTHLARNVAGLRLLDDRAREHVVDLLGVQVCAVEQAAEREPQHVVGHQVLVADGGERMGASKSECARGKCVGVYAHVANKAQISAVELGR